MKLSETEGEGKQKTKTKRQGSRHRLKFLPWIKMTNLLPIFTGSPR
jgi:hypothetical protein